MMEELYKQAYIKVQRDRQKLIEQNKRYRKAIEKSLHEVRYGYSDVAEEILLEALEGEK